MDPTNLQAHGQQKMRQAPAAPRRYDGIGGNPMYDPANGGHYGTSSCAPAVARAGPARLHVNTADHCSSRCLRERTSSP